MAYSASDMGLVNLADQFIGEVRRIQDTFGLNGLVGAIAREMGFRFYGLAHHDDLRTPRPDRVLLSHYPSAVVERLQHNQRYRRDPMVRASARAGGAFLWSEVGQLIRVDRQDLAALEFGVREGLNEGITIPYARLGDCFGSCTFAGMREPDRARNLVGPAQLIGIFAFQAALRLLASQPTLPLFPRLKPRPRDCIILAGQGLSNKEIARALALAPRTVDGYLTEARATFGVHDRTELVIAALLAGEIGLHELRRNQPE